MIAAIRAAERMLLLHYVVSLFVWFGLRAVFSWRMPLPFGGRVHRFMLSYYIRDSRMEFPQALWAFRLERHNCVLLDKSLAS